MSFLLAPNHSVHCLLPLLFRLCGFAASIQHRSIAIQSGWTIGFELQSFLESFHRLWIALLSGINATQIAPSLFHAPISLDSALVLSNSLIQKPGLVQLNAGGRIFVIDPIALTAADPLAALRAPRYDHAWDA